MGCRSLGVDKLLMTTPRPQRGYPKFVHVEDRNDYMATLILNGHRVRKVNLDDLIESHPYTVADIDGRRGSFAVE